MLDAILRSAAFLLGAVAITIAVHGYLYRRLIRDTDLPPPWRKRARITMFLVAALLPAGMVGLLMMRQAPRSVAAPLMWCAFGWVGLLLFLLPMMLLGDAVRAAARPTDPERRRVIARLIGIVSGAATLVLGGGAAACAQLQPLVRRIRAPLRGLGAHMNGYRLVQNLGPSRERNHRSRPRRVTRRERQRARALSRGHHG